MGGKRKPAPGEMAGLIYRLRTQLGMTQTTFAQEVGVCQNMICRYELGLMRPSLVPLIALYAMAADARDKSFLRENLASLVPPVAHKLFKALQGTGERELVASEYTDEAPRKFSRKHERMLEEILAAIKEIKRNG
jgi:transcriptional regulator with XRE-family HTH domain